MTHADPQRYITSMLRVIEKHRRRMNLKDHYDTRREYYDAISAVKSLFVDYLEVSQVQHRHHLGNANELMVKAIELAERLARLWVAGNELPDSGVASSSTTFEGWNWNDIPKRIDGIGFRFGTSAILSLLVRDEMSAEIIRAVPKLSSWNASLPSIVLNFADAGLVEMLQTGKAPTNWTVLLESCSAIFGRPLFEETWCTYGKIILESKHQHWEDAVRSIETCQELYEKRAEFVGDCDEFSAWEGIGSGNGLSIDLRLSALMRYCFRENQNLLDPLQSIHRWRS